ncbi:hypothetical protein NliqN6_3252 [Naganishia liquefaciens]|uniref:SelT/SelW/SelH family protein n=1 Tax=Naganishia liquefaciens TaxID=104408 RepID=A0A8H3TUC3_9TREE|nr:hypothetical protein NliqN6_3252 [Naganishia liquefaciens]
MASIPTPDPTCLDCRPEDPGQRSSSQPKTASAKQDEDVEDPSTFRPLERSIGPAVTIEYCDGCRWAPRASWTATELFLTFPSPTITSITLTPATEHPGRFRVWLQLPSEESPRLMWDRKVEGGFPELKVLKQRIRNVIQPKQNLGHSDKA